MKKIICLGEICFQKIVFREKNRTFQKNENSKKKNWFFKNFDYRNFRISKIIIFEIVGFSFFEKFYFFSRKTIFWKHISPRQIIFSPRFFLAIWNILLVRVNNVFSTPGYFPWGAHGQTIHWPPLRMVIQ